MKTVAHAPAADAHGQHQVVALLFGFRLQVAQTAEQAFGVCLGYGFRIDIPAADAVANVNVRLEVAPRVEESRFIFDFAALFSPFGHHITPQAIHFMEAGHADETNDDFIVSGRGDVGQVVAASAVIFRIAALQAAIVLRPVGVVTKDLWFGGRAFVFVIDRFSDAV